MRQSIAHVALVVRDYDEAIAFFTQKLKFVVVEDRYQVAPDKQWVVEPWERECLSRGAGSVQARDPTRVTALLRAHGHAGCA